VSGLELELEVLVIPEVFPTPVLVSALYGRLLEIEDPEALTRKFSV
jgi:hypothetical protein